ncbi:MAG: antirestriction protein [Nitrospira sp.]
MEHINHDQPSVVATLVPDEERLHFLPRHFGKHMLTVEHDIYSQFGNLCLTYTGGYWHFYDLSNGGCYLAPSQASYSLMHTGNDFDATVSGDAAGIIVSLFTFSHLSFTLEEDPLGPRIANYFHWLRAFAAGHPESHLILRAID